MPKPKPYTLSALALAELEAVAAAHSVPVTDLVAHTCESARAFTGSTYYVLSAWFKKQPRHDFEAFIIRRNGTALVSQRMVLDVADRRVMSHVEWPLDDLDYHAYRITEEVTIDSEVAATRGAQQ